jgi:hypothetical protein
MKALWVIARAKRERDFAPLIALLRSNAPITAEIRELLADILEGKLKVPANRPASLSTHLHHLLMALRVRQLASDRPTKAARVEAAKEFGVTERTIGTATRKLKEYEKRFGPYDPDPLRELNELKRAFGITDEKK